MTTPVLYNILAHTYNVMTTIMSTMHFLTETMFILTAINPFLTLLHSEWPKLYGVLAILSAKGLKGDSYDTES